MTGLSVKYGALDPEEQERLLGEVLEVLKDVMGDTRLERHRVRRFGWDYLGTGMWMGGAPPGIYAVGIYPEEFESVTVNEYLAGHGITGHIDSDRFGEPIVTVSLGAEATMFFERDGKTHHCLLRPGTKVSMSGESRWTWNHGLEPDNRETRWSVVYRHRC